MKYLDICDVNKYKKRFAQSVEDFLFTRRVQVKTVDTFTLPVEKEIPPHEILLGGYNPTQILGYHCNTNVELANGKQFTFQGFTSLESGLAELVFSCFEEFEVQNPSQMSYDSHHFAVKFKQRFSYENSNLIGIRILQNDEIVKSDYAVGYQKFMEWEPDYDRLLEFAKEEKNRRRKLKNEMSKPSKGIGGFFDFEDFK